MNENNVTRSGVYIPGKVSLTVRLSFAIANTDFRKSSKDGNGELHGTMIVMKQNNCVPIVIDTNFTEPEEDNDEDVENEVESRKNFAYKIKMCHAPTKPDTSDKSYEVQGLCLYRRKSVQD